MNPTKYHPFVRASLQKAVRAFLQGGKHGHLTPTELVECHECVQRLWVELEKAAPVKTIQVT